MFGFPGQTLDQWHDDLRMALQLDVEHISAYSLMYEEGTPLYEMLMRHEVEEIDEQKYIIMYKTLVEMLKAAGYEHYEISNFARPGKRSRHNSSYWTDTPYLGIGAGAHSYDGTCRMSHVTDVGQYIAAINQGILPEETELLSADERYNDMVTTAMRTAEGISISELTQKFGQQKTDYLLKNAQKALYNQWLVLEDDRLHLTLQGIMVSDSVMSDLMMV